MLTIGQERFGSLQMSLWDIYPELRNWNYRELYKRTRPIDTNQTGVSSFSFRRRGELNKIVNFITSYLDMDFNIRAEVFKAAIKYYLVLLDAERYKLDFEIASDELFEGV